MSDKKINLASETDVMKVIAVLSVMWQGLLTLMNKQPVSSGQKVELTILYSFVKFSAPAFIFAITFDLAKLRDVKYKKYLPSKAKEILIPYLCWTIVYMLTINPTFYKSASDIVQAIIFGTASGHLWYTIMMFQFHILILAIGLLANRVLKNKKNSIPVLIIGTLIYMIFLFIYDKYIFTSTNKYLGYADRTFIMFSIYCVMAVTASVNYEKFKSFIHKIKFYLIPLFLLTFIIANNEILKNGMKKVSFQTATYLKPSMFLYNVLIILLIFAFALMLQNHNSKLLPKIKFLSTYAFRAYLANIFCLNLIVKIMGKSLKSLPMNMSLIIIYIAVVAFSFTLVYIIHRIVCFFKSIFTKAPAVEAI